ncbi:MAG TPA: DUF1772 domain-containing protein [Polyangiaceae bacterium]
MSSLFTSGHFVTLVTLLDGLLAGLFIGSSMVEHGARAFTPSVYIPYKHAKEAVFGPVMPVAFNLCLVLTAIAAFVTPSHLTFGVAAALMTLVMTITITIHLPLNKTFQSWSPDVYPVTWKEGRARWRNWNLVRAAFVIAAFGLVLVGQV